MGGGEHSLNWEFFMPEGDGGVLRGDRVWRRAVYNSSDKLFADYGEHGCAIQSPYSAQMTC